MAKRAAPDEKPYRPLLDTELVNAALSNAGPAALRSSPAQRHSAVEANVVEMRVANAKLRIDQQDSLAAPTRTFDSAAENGSLKNEQERDLVERFDREKRILFTRPEEQAIDRLVTSLAARVNAQLKLSHLIRALVTLALHAEGQIDKRAGETPPLVRPPNGDAQGLQRFEREIGNILAAGLRDAGPLR
jgi:hypothetical protein